MHGHNGAIVWFDGMKLLTWICLAILALGLGGCASKSIKPAEEAADDKLTIDILPLDLTVEPGDERMTIRWKRSGDGLISGYNIYIGEEPVTSGPVDLNAIDTITPFNLGPYPGDTNPDDGVETFEAENLVNGTKYYVLVRTVLPDQSLSAPSNEEIAICGPRGEITLDARYAGEKDGYSFKMNQYVRADSPDNDLYFYHKDGSDYLASPSRLGGYTRRTGLAKIDFRGELEGLRPRLAKGVPQPTEDRATIQIGDWVHLRTADNTNAVLKVIDLKGQGRDRKVTLYMAFCPAEGEMLF